MNISAVNSTMSGLAAAQGMFAGAAQAAEGVASPASGSGDGGSAVEAAQVAVLRMTLQMERSAVNILA